MPVLLLICSIKPVLIEEVGKKEFSFNILMSRTAVGGTVIDYTLLNFVIGGIQKTSHSRSINLLKVTFHNLVFFRQAPTFSFDPENSSLTRHACTSDV